MAENRNNISILVNECVQTSIEFETLMDKTDFDSWLETDNPGVLRGLRQEISPFHKFKKNKKKLESICCQMREKGTSKRPKSKDKSLLEKYIVYQLFESKSKRVKARISFKKEEYEKALRDLLPVHDVLQNSKGVINDKRWMILLYNDLSICYAGLENSSMSRGYAEEAKRIMEEEESYEKFDQKFSADNSVNMANIADDEFVSSRFYDLYVVTLFNQALAEKLSYSYSEAERDFKKIIKYAERDTHLLNFNYYSTLLNLGDLYIDLGRGNEAIELLDKAINRNKLDENDIRYWNVCLAKINALIDQSEYDEAEKLLKKFKEKKKDFTLCKKHRVTFTGFKGLNYYARCKIEKVRNTLGMNDNDRKKEEKKNDELEKVEKIIKDNIGYIKKRKQEGLENKAYKQLSDIYIIYSKNRDDSKYYRYVREYLVKFISKKRGINDLDGFIKHRDMNDWIDGCDDLDALESFIDQIIKVMENEPTDGYINLLEKIGEKAIKECEDKDQLSRAERIARKINEARKGKEYGESIRKFLSNINPLDKRSSDKEDLSKKDKGLTNKDIWKRLDINEKNFDKVLFDRSKLKKDDHMVEVIVLRRWNSFSPGLFRESTGSLGGGYLLRIKKNSCVENIVIDPGYNFLQNFRMEGFYINDIDTIIVTHSHLDHCAELLPVMDLIYQFNKRYKDTPYGELPRKRVNLCLSRGAYRKFFSYIDDPDWKKQLKDVIILENLAKMKWEPFKGLKISAIPTPHMDLGGAKAIGLRIEIDGGQEKNLCLGFTGDTPWYPKIIEHFKGCDLLCVHLGSIRYQEIGFTDKRYEEDTKREIENEDKKNKELQKIYLKSNHLLFFGTENVINHCTKKGENSLIIVGEFGEELKYGLRRYLCTELSKETKVKCLPGDIELYIGIDKNGTKKVRCNFCEEFVEQKEIRTFSYGREDAIHYICETCHNTLSELQKQAVVEHRLTRH